MPKVRPLVPYSYIWHAAARALYPAVHFAIHVLEGLGSSGRSDQISVVEDLESLFFATMIQICVVENLVISLAESGIGSFL